MTTATLNIHDLEAMKLLLDDNTSEIQLIVTFNLDIEGLERCFSLMNIESNIRPQVQPIMNNLRVSQAMEDLLGQWITELRCGMEKSGYEVIDLENALLFTFTELVCPAAPHCPRRQEIKREAISRRFGDRLLRWPGNAWDQFKSWINGEVKKDPKNPVLLLVQIKTEEIDKGDTNDEEN